MTTTRTIQNYFIKSALLSILPFYLSSFFYPIAAFTQNASMAATKNEQETDTTLAYVTAVDYFVGTHFGVKAAASTYAGFSDLHKNMAIKRDPIQSHFVALGYSNIYDQPSHIKFRIERAEQIISVEKNPARLAELNQELDQMKKLLPIAEEQKKLSQAIIHLYKEMNLGKEDLPIRDNPQVPTPILTDAERAKKKAEMIAYRETIHAPFRIMGIVSEETYKFIRRAIQDPQASNEAIRKFLNELPESTRALLLDFISKTPDHAKQIPPLLSEALKASYKTASTCIGVCQKVFNATSEFVKQEVDTNRIQRAEWRDIQKRRDVAIKKFMEIDPSILPDKNTMTNPYVHVRYGYTVKEYVRDQQGRLFEVEKLKTRSKIKAGIFAIPAFYELFTVYDFFLEKITGERLSEYRPIGSHALEAFRNRDAILDSTHKRSAEIWEKILSVKEDLGQKIEFANPSIDSSKPGNKTGE